MLDAVQTAAPAVLPLAPPDPRPVTWKRRGRVLLPLLLALGPTGCDDEPDCHISATLSGAVAGDYSWLLVGRDHCGFANTEALAPGTSALAFIDDENSDVSLYVMLEQASIAAGLYEGRLVYTLDGRIWASLPGACTVEISEFELEQWTQTDFIRFQGNIRCPELLVPVAPNEGDLAATEIEFDGHVHAEVLTYPFP